MVYHKLTGDGCVRAVVRKARKCAVPLAGNMIESQCVRSSCGETAQGSEPRAGSLRPCSRERWQFSGLSVDSKKCFRGVKGEFVSLDWLLCVPLCTARPTGREECAGPPFG